MARWEPMATLPHVVGESVEVRFPASSEFEAAGTEVITATEGDEFHQWQDAEGDPVCIHDYTGWRVSGPVVGPVLE